MPAVPPPEKGWPPLPCFRWDRHKETGGLWEGQGASPVCLIWSHEGPETTFVGPVWGVLGSVRVSVRTEQRGPRPVLGLHLRPPETPAPGTGLGQRVFAEPCASLSTTGQ